MHLRDRLCQQIDRHCRINLSSKIQLDGVVLEVHHDYLLLEHISPHMEPSIIPFSGISSIECQRIEEDK